MKKIYRLFILIAVMNLLNLISASVSSSAPTVIKYTYDDLNRLTVTDTSSYLLNYEYDEIGNIMNRNAEKRIVSIEVTPVSSSIILGNTRQFTAIGRYQDGSEIDITASASWASSNPSIATINTAGLATGVGVGTTNITASLDSVISTVSTLTVTNDLASIAVTPVRSKVLLGNTIQYKAMGTYKNGTSADITTFVTWSSSDSFVAAINSNGMAASVNAGRTNITASLGQVTSALNILTVYNNGWYDDAGNSANEPHLVSGTDYAVFGSAPEQTVSYGGEVIYLYSGFNPVKTYMVTLTYYDPGTALDLTTRLTTESGAVIHGDIKPDNRIKRYSFNLPASDYADGIIELHFKPNNSNNLAIVSEILIEEEP